MSLAEMHACLARLYVEDAFRQLFYHDPTAVLAGYKLTAQETAALTGLDRAMLDAFAGSLKRKRRGKFAATYPLILKLDAAEMDRYYDRYCQLYPERPYDALRTQLLDFGRFMEESLAADPDLPPWAGDLARYERLYCAARGPAGPRGASAAPTTDLTPGARPYLRPGVEVGTFRYDVLALAAAVLKDEARDCWPEGEYCLVFQPGGAGGKPRLFTVTPATRDLLERCDGSASVGAIVAATERALGKRDLATTVMQILANLLAQETIGIAADADES